MYYVYILKSLKDKRLYIGITCNLQRRLDEHNQGLNSSTASRTPLKLIYCEVFRSKSDAIRREINLKKFKKTYSELKKRLSGSLNF